MKEFAEKSIKRAVYITIQEFVTLGRSWYEAEWEAGAPCASSHTASTLYLIPAADQNFY